MLELCSIASGSSGNCICVGNANTHLLIDVGISGKRVEQGLHNLDLKISEMQGILITHEHLDHIAGLGVLARRYGIPMYATSKTIDAILQTKAVGKVDKHLFSVISAGNCFQIGDLTIKAISISHDAADPVVYRISEGQKSVAVVTDLGTYDERLIEELQGLDALLLEANHDRNMLQTGKYPYSLKQRILGDKGHLSNETSGQLLGAILHDNFQGVLLGHLSKENNYEALAYEAVRLEVTMGENPYKAEDFPMLIAKRDANSPKMQL